MIDFSNVINLLLGNTPVEQVADSYGNILWSSSADPSTVYFYVEDLSGADNTLTITKSNYSAPAIEVFKSTDQENWTSMGITDESNPITATVPANSKLYLKAITNSWANVYYGINNITASGNHSVGGNIMSLLYGDNFINQTAFQADYAFNGLFMDDTTLLSTDNLILPATTLSVCCYRQMFQSCDSLATTPVLPATTLTDGCYLEMFYGCTSLTTAPALPATTLANNCYGGMFNNCRALTTAPALSATTLADSCYASMFSRCTALTTAPALPATTLTTECYTDMFNGCRALTTTPALPATTLANYCYKNMFSGCTGITTAPELPATTLTNYCYQNMFYGCSSLNSITTYATSISATDCLNNWVNGVAASGDFYNEGNIEYEKNSTSGIPTGWTEHSIKTGYFFIEDLSGVNNTLTIRKDDNSAPAIDFYVSTDKENWTRIGNPDISGMTATIPANGKLFIKSVSTQWGDSTHYNFISASGNHGVGGSVMSLLYGDNFINQTAFQADYAFNGLFMDDTTLLSTDNLTLPATALSVGCYQNMFRGCTGLATAPELPATALTNNCYSNMFYGCSSLNSITTYATNISATNCLNNWVSGVAATGDFYNEGDTEYTVDSASGIPTGWTEHLPDYSKEYFFIQDKSGADNTLSITKSQSAATTVTVYYSTDKVTWTSMGATSMTAITATVPANSKLYLRANVTRWGYSSSSTRFNSIKMTGNYIVGGNILSLLYGTGYNRNSMNTYAFPYLFNNDTKLLSSKRLALPSVTANSCYNSMFNGCSNMKDAPTLPATTMTTYCYNGMFNGCRALTTAPVLPATTLATYCYQSMFNGCRALTTAPVLPATTLQNYCYYFMFSGCTGLTTAPVLSATTLVNGCYYYMFNGCSRINSITTYATSISATDCLNNWVNGVAASGDFYNLGNPAPTYPSGSWGIPDGWTEHTSL